MSRIIAGGYFLVGTIYLVALTLDVPFFTYLTKPMLMLVLGVWYWFSTKPQVRSMVVLVALGFSLIGDCLLMYTHLNPHYFEGGLGAFLLAQIAYIVAYRQHRDAPNEEENPLSGLQKFRMSFPVVLAITGMAIVLYPKLGSLQIPVFLYMMAIGMMVLQAVFRFQRTSAASYTWVLIGSVLFMFSDSVIAIHKFVTPVPMDGLVVMITYIFAQWFIIRGLVHHAMA